eukprot:symbB.v1.2.005258.t1/scaffold304.1/size234131/17
MATTGPPRWRRQGPLDCFGSAWDNSEDEGTMDFESPAVSRVLRRYPDVDISTLTFPSDAPEWTEQEFELFVGSGGFLKPKRRRNNGPGIQSNGAYSPRNPAFIPIDQREAQAAASSSSSSTHKMLPKRETDTPLDYAPGPVLTTPGVAVLPELPLTTWHEGAYWAPYATYMEDVDENGMRLVAALNKCERFRNVGLKKGAGFTLNALKEKFGAGILLREFAMEVLGEIPSNIMSLLWVSLRLELPCSPFMPMYQVMVPEGRQKAVCKGVFGMLMLDTATMSVLNDNKIYEEVAEPLRKAFSLKKPDGSEGVPKFPRIYPGRGSPFRPLQVMSTTYTAGKAGEAEALLSLMQLPSPQDSEASDRSLEAPLGRELLTYQSPRQKRARAWINEFDVPNVKSPERKRRLLGSSPRATDGEKKLQLLGSSPKRAADGEKKLQLLGSSPRATDGEKKLQLLGSSPRATDGEKKLQVLGSSTRATDGEKRTANVKESTDTSGIVMGFHITAVLTKLPDRSVLLAKKGEEPVALKILQKHPALAPKPRVGFEAEVMQKLQHPNIVKLLQVMEDEERLCLVMEYVPGGDMLQDIMRQGRFLEAHAQRLLAELAETMSYVHSRNVVHRDLKPENILLTSQLRDTMQVKISDFGISKLTTSSQDCRTYLGSRDYRAPEVVRCGINRKQKSDRGGYGKPADMWSLGVVLYVMLSGERAFESQSKVEVEILQGLWSFTAEVWNSISQDAKDLVRSLMQQDPKKRFTAEQLLQHRWLMTPASPKKGRVWMARGAVVGIDG